MRTLGLKVPEWSLTKFKARLKEWVKHLARGHTTAHRHCFRRRVQFDAVQTTKVYSEAILKLSMGSAVAMASTSGKKWNVVLRCEFNLGVHHSVNHHASRLARTKEVKGKGWLVGFEISSFDRSNAPP